MKLGLSVVGTRIVLRIFVVVVLARIAAAAAADLWRLAAAVSLVAAARCARRVAIGACRSLLALAIYFNDVAAAVEEVISFVAVHLAFEAATACAIGGGRTRANTVTAAGGIFMLIVLCVAAHLNLVHGKSQWSQAGMRTGRFMSEDKHARTGYFSSLAGSFSSYFCIQYFSTTTSAC